MNYFRNDATCSEIHKKADIYCYGMTMLEVLERRKPWGDVSSEEIQEKVLAGQRPHASATLLESCQNDESIQAIYEVVQQCWQLIPADRPTSDAIIQKLEKKMNSEESWSGSPK